MTQVELAQRLGVSRTWVSRLEGGDGNPTVSQLFVLGTIFNVRPGKLVSTCSQALEDQGHFSQCCNKNK